MLGYFWKAGLPVLSDKPGMFDSTCLAGSCQLMFVLLLCCAFRSSIHEKKLRKLIVPL